MRSRDGVARWSIAGLALAVAACGGGGGGGTAAPPPTVTLSASAHDVRTGAPATLTWSSTNASSCTASGAWSGTLSTSGSQAVNVAQTGTYSLTCAGSGGSANAAATITAWSAPTVSVSADNAALLPNNTAVITWSSTNASACAASSGLAGNLATSGSQTSAPLASTTTFVIGCQNPAWPSVSGSTTVTVSSTFALDVATAYTVPGAPVVNAARTYYVPDWAHPLTHPIPFVHVELDDAGGAPVVSGYADATGVAHFTNLDPGKTYTPVLESSAQDGVLGIDFAVLNNTGVADTTQATFRKRYPPFVTQFAPYTPGTKLAAQQTSITTPDGWDPTTGVLDDANRVSGPYALLANAMVEAQIVSAAIGRQPQWRPLTILWSVKNKGGLTAPPDQFDAGSVTGSGGFYNSGHGALDAQGQDTGAFVAEDFIFVSGDQSSEPMDLYAFVMTHEMGHFTQDLFSTRTSPGGSHGYSDYEDALQAWIEGDASAIALLVAQSPLENRVGQVAGTLVVGVYDHSQNPPTVSGNHENWPIGWFQESSVTGMIWSIFDPSGGVQLSAAATLAATYSNAWRTGPWLNAVWPYLTLTKQANSAAASAIDSAAVPFAIASAGTDVWGAGETNAGERTSQDALPIYTTLAIGSSAQVCSVGNPNEYNKESNVRYLRLFGDGGTHTLTVTGAAGRVPLIDGFQFNSGANVTSLTGVVSSAGQTATVGDCTVSLSQYSTNTAACQETQTTPPETCWTVTYQ